jgi:flagellar biosynthesis component FlhA
VVRQGRKPILLCDPRVRAPLRRMIAPLMPDAAVLAYSEVDSVEVQSVGSVGIE